MTSIFAERAHQKTGCWCECADAEHYYFQGLFTGRALELSMPVEWRPGYACHSCERQLAAHLKASTYAAMKRKRDGREMTDEELLLLVKIGITDTPGPAN